MAKIIVVRHAESIANTLGIFQGQTYNTGLSPLGKKQAKALARKLSFFEVDKIISSPLKRTKETAEKVAKIGGWEVAYDDKIIETNHGVWEGKDKGWIEKNYGRIYKTWLTSPSKVIFHGGENFLRTVERVKNFIHDRSWKGSTLLITHDNIIRIMVCLAKNLSIDEMWNVYIEPASISVFKIVGIDGSKKLSVISLNEASHLGEFRADITKHAL